MRVKLIDLYSGNTFNPGQIKMDGYAGVIFKAGQGAWADVPRYHPEWWQMAKDNGLLRGWYWLCDSRQHSSKHIDEMNKWNVFSDLGELGLWADLEKPMIAMSEVDYWATPYAGYKNIVDFYYLLRLKGIIPGTYTGPGAYELIMRGAPKSAHDYLALTDLWTAQYPFVYIEGISKPKLYGSWTKWTLWQYREGPDINIFNGTDAEFYEKYKSIPPVEEPPQGEPMLTGTVLVSTLNIRSTPSSASAATIIGQLTKNDVVEAASRTLGWWQLTKITRAGVNVPLPAAICYAYEGANNGYIRVDSAPPQTTNTIDVIFNGENVFHKDF